MTKISIILSCRNRDIERLKRCLDSFKNQSFTDFEVVFIDYGSDEIYRNPVKTLVSLFSFCRYFYVYSQGLPWNRSHAINIGIRLAESDYLLITDIDVIHSINHLEILFNSRDKNSSIYNPVYWLHEDFSDYDAIIKDGYKINKKNYSYISRATGTSHFISKDIMEAIGGYDQFYNFWGVEDRDLASRLRKKGLKEHWLELGRAPLFHQWHPIVSFEKDGLFPDKWWEDMNIYYQLNIDKIERNDENWGKFLLKDDRPVFDSVGKIFEFDNKLLGPWDKMNIICKIIKELNELKSNECLVINIPTESHSGRKARIMDLTNKFLSRKNTNVRLEYINRIDRDKHFLPQRDILYVIWQLYTFEGQISDLYFDFTEHNQQIKICKKGLSTLGLANNVKSTMVK
jgi:glycosyltransferase involved in cell wall biosynthesis